MTITQEEIDRGDIVDPELLEQAQADLGKNEDPEPEEEGGEEEEATEETGEDEGEESEDEDEDSGEGDSDEEGKDEEESTPQSEEGDDTDPEPEEEDDTGDEGNRIPLSRLNKALAQRDMEKDKREVLEGRTAWLEKQMEELIATKQLPAKDEVVEDPFDFTKAEHDYFNLMLEGEEDKAVALRGEINAELAQAMKNDIASVKDDTRAERMAEKEQEIFDIAIDNFENKYPFMDVNHDDYNVEAVDTTNALLTGYMADGKMSRTEALEKAVKQVAPMFGKEVKEGLGKPKTSQRLKDTRKKSLKTMKQTPPKMRGKTRQDRDVSDVKAYDLSQKEFKSLTKREKAEMRGDHIGS